ncbi:hypothetical protein P9112_005097 [Eukaryota sp. TZLM1-RC]
MSTQFKHIFDPLSEQDFQKIEQEYFDNPSSRDKQLTYAYACVHSNNEKNVDAGLAILHQLLTTAPSHHEQLECHYLSALGKFKMERLTEAEKDLKEALSIQDHPQATQLMKAIKQKKRDNLKKQVGYVAAAALGTAAIFIAKSKAH